MGVIKRKSKTAKNGYTYEVNFTYKEHGVTKRHFKRGFITKKEAELYEVEKKNEVQKNGALGKKKKITLNEAFNEFLLYGSGQYQENTIYNTRKDWHYFKENLGLMQINEITHTVLQSYFNDRIEEGLSTNKNIRKTLNRIFVYCIRQQYIDNNPLQFVIVKGEDRSRKKEVLSQNDLNKLVNKLREKNKFKYDSYAIAILIGFYTGLRISEVLALYKSDIDFENDLIRVEKKLVFKGLRKQDYYVSKQMKSKKSKALIPLPLILKNQLNQWLEVNPYARIVCNEDGSFVNPTCLSNQVKKIASSCEINFRFHMLRHSYASILIYNRTDIRIAQDLLRHSNFNTTLSIYTHINEEQKKQAVNEVFKIDCGNSVADSKRKNESPKKNPLCKGVSK